jgi:hypothetical protein
MVVEAGEAVGDALLFGECWKQELLFEPSWELEQHLLNHDPGAAIHERCANCGVKTEYSLDTTD